jgi:asparagine synthase (glutamine-hydrolysing)
MGLGFNDIERFALLNEVWYYEIKPDIMKIYDSNIGDTPLLKSQFTDIKVVLEGDMFVKTDRVCMMNSLESRAPFIDTKIVRLAFELPDHFKIKGRNKKYILKETFKDILPSKTIYFRKKGFGVPVDYWFKNELRDELEQLLNKDFVEKQGIFRYEIIKRLLDEHIAGKQNHKGKLWNLFVFQKWYLKNS